MCNSYKMWGNSHNDSTNYHEKRKWKGTFMSEELMQAMKQKYITKVLLNLGVPAHLKGYHYLRTAIMMSEKDIEIVSSVTKLLYPEVAKVYKTTPQKVERAIRNAIEVSWMRSNMDAMEEVFGLSADTGRGRPTNSEYIARIADAVQLEFMDVKVEAANS